MEGSENTWNLDNITRKFKELAGPGSKTAMGVLLARFAESRRPEGERICYDPYAVHFVSPGVLEWAAGHPEEVKATQKQRECLFPGLDNSVVARVRFFDDFVKKSIDEGVQQLVILGAGYDSRAYRIDGLKKIRTFEVDHPATQTMKKEKINKIFGHLPDNIVYIPCDLGTDDLRQRLFEMGYDRSKKTLFLMEGLLCYLRPAVVDGIFSFIVKNSGEGSAVLFDYHPQSVVNGSSESVTGRNIWKHVSLLGEPFQFGIEGSVETFLAKRGFSKVQNVTSEDYKKAYFHGANEDRAVFSLLYFAHAVVE